jgi:hypothetical protein
MRMTLIKLEQEASELSGHIGEIVEQLKDLKRELRMVQGYVQSEEPGHVREALRCAGDIRTFIRHAYEVEAKYNEERRRELGLAGDAGFDLDAARAEIGCKLDRLRACCAAGAVS